MTVKTVVASLALLVFAGDAAAQSRGARFQDFVHNDQRLTAGATHVEVIQGELRLESSCQLDGSIHIASMTLIGPDRPRARSKLVSGGIGWQASPLFPDQKMWNFRVVTETLPNVIFITNAEVQVGRHRLQIAGATVKLGFPGEWPCYFDFVVRVTPPQTGEEEPDDPPT